jgi:hypothetical protein
MKTARHGIAVALILCVVAAFYLSLRHVDFPDATRIDATIKDFEPIQQATDEPPFAVSIHGYTYTLTPRASYDISGLVVSQHRGDAFTNMYHKADPGNIRDVCVVWGEAITNGSYRKVRFRSEEFTCYYSWSGVITPPFNPEKMSNNHLIPATPAVAARIGALHVGDQIRMTGLLVDYTVSRDGAEVLSRRSSMTRKDVGNGACEILYTTGLSVVVPGDHLEMDAGRYAWYTSLGLFLALAVVWFARPPVA